MAPLARFRNSIILCLIALAFGCNLTEKENNLTIKLNSSERGLNVKNGIIFYYKQPYTGYIFTLFENNKDTSTSSGYLNGKEHGTWKKFYPNGKLQEIRRYDNGKKIGKYSAYWEDGSKKLNYSFKDDEYEGLCQEWNRAGKLIKAMHYSKGHEEGRQKMYDDEGKLRSNYRIINGRRYGLLGTKNCTNVSDSISKK